MGVHLVLVIPALMQWRVGIWGADSSVFCFQGRADGWMCYHAQARLRDAGINNLKTCAFFLGFPLLRVEVGSHERCFVAVLKWLCNSSGLSRIM